MAEAGWYADPYDTSQLRYFNGSQWTVDTQPMPATGQEKGPGSAQDHQAAPASGSGPQQAPAPPWTTPTGTDTPVTSGQPQAGQPQTKKKPLLVAIAILAAVALLVLLLVFVVFNSSPQFTYQNKPINKPKLVLQSAQTNFKDYVRNNHGSTNGSSRCYFLQPRQPASGEKKTNVKESVSCGPVLFPDGNRNREYLSFPLTASQANGGNENLTVGKRPDTETPRQLDSSYIAKRPDNATPPPRGGGLKVPAPAPAPANVLAKTDMGPVKVPPAPAGSVMGSLDGGVQLVSLGEVSRYGYSLTARSAPPGQKLIAFSLQGARGDDGSMNSLADTTQVQVGTAPPRPLPTGNGSDYVVAVPKDANPVNLVLNDGGVTQTLSLLDGKPGPNNIQVLARSNRSYNGNQTQNVVVNFSSPITDNGSPPLTTVSLPTTLTQASLNYWQPDKTTPNNPSQAFLLTDLGYQDPNQPGGPGTLWPPNAVTFTPAGGQPIPAIEVTNPNDKVLGGTAFVVPANTTSGTITVAGSLPNFANSGVTATIPPVSFQITFG